MRGRSQRSSAARAPGRILSTLGGATLAGAALVLAPGCSAPAPFHKEARWPPPRAGAVVSEHPLATEVGLAILERGGNAADAAIATALALAVVYPQAGNLGGGGFAVWAPHRGEALAIDFRETAPAAADPGRFLDARGERVPARSLVGPLAVGIPGTPAGLHLLYERCASGVLSLAELAAPAVHLARAGFEVDAWLARDLARPAVRAKLNAPALELFFPRGEPLAEGERLRQPDLAETIAAFAAIGPSAFYSGLVADALLAELEASAVPDGERDGAIVYGPASGRGWITHADLVGYRAIARRPLTGWFRGMELVTMPPPSSGGVVALQALGVLEGLPLDAERERARAARSLELSKGAAPPPDDPGLDERMLHWWIEALRGAFADRAAHLGDPNGHDVPVEELLSPSWIAARRVAIGESAAVDVAAWEPEPEGGETTHLSVLDRDGNAVSLTTTLNTSFGSGLLVRRAGFLLNSQIDDFAITPSSPNAYGLVGGAANRLAPGRRPLSSMTPLVVRDGGHATTMVLGSPDGPRIISSLVQVLLRVLVLEQPIEAAVAAPRLHQQWNPKETSFEPAFDPELVEALGNRRGQPTKRSEELFGSVQAIWLERAGLRPIAVSDPRRGGSAAVERDEGKSRARPPREPER